MVVAPQCREQVGHHRLDTERQPGHSGRAIGRKRPGGDRFRIALDSDFGVRVAPDGSEDTHQQLDRQQ
jgi:hypothetical protein